MTTESDLEFMLDTDLWPKWPYLPLRKSNTLSTGILVDATGDGTLRTTYFFFEDDPRQGLERIKKGGRELVEELVRNGWVVD